MDSLGVQLSKILERRFEKIIPDALDPTLLEIFKQMNVNTASGRSFGDQKYNNVYSKRHAKARTNIGLLAGDVDLRFKQRGITQERKIFDQVIEAKKAAAIGFANQDEGKIFYYHHTGMAKGGKVRMIFPQEWRVIPQTIIEAMRLRIGKVFNAG
jgi:hypothetical protein